MVRAASGADVGLFAIDVFYDAPIGSNGSALTAYAVAQFNDYGEDYLFGSYGSGTMIYGHVGYVLPSQVTPGKWQPYVSFMNNNFDFNNDTRNILGIGLNYYVDGNNAKVSAEFRNTSFQGNSTNQIIVQGMIYL